MKNLYVCLDLAYIDIESISNNIFINNSLTNISNHYVFKNTMNFMTNNNHNNIKYIVGWTNLFTDDCYNDTLKRFTISKNKDIELHDLNKENLGFIKKMYYKELNNYSKIFFEKYRKDFLYNIMLKITFITSLDIVLKSKKYDYIFLDNMIISPMIIRKMIERKPPNHFQYYNGTLKQYERLLKSDTKYILYKDFKRELIQ